VARNVRDAVVKRISGAAVLTFVALTGAQPAAIPGWAVNTKTGDDGCTAYFEYAEHGRTHKGVGLRLQKTKDGQLLVTLLLEDESWRWAEGETVEADFVIDQSLYAARVRWHAGEVTRLSTTFLPPTDALLGILRNATELAVRATGTYQSETTFQVPKPDPAIDALRSCVHEP